MRYCSKCKVNIIGNSTICPLCQNAIHPTNNCDDVIGDNIFPSIPTTYQKYNMFFRSMIFISVVIAVISVGTNFIFYQFGWWSLFVLGGIACVWISLAIIIRKRHNIPKTILWQMVSISILAVIWDISTGWHAWSISYVIPSLCVAAMITMAIISKVMKLLVADYVIYLVIDSLFGIIPIIFLLTKIVTTVFPSIICISGSIISLSALLLFQGESMKAELKRRTHM